MLRQKKSHGEYGAYFSCKQGMLKHCFKCNPAKHFVCDNCLRNNINTVMESDHVHFTRFNLDMGYQNVINDSNIKMSKLVRETLSIAVLDSACSWTVEGNLWFDIFFDMLNDQDKRLVKTVKYNRTIYFGDGIEVKAINSVKFPVTI